NGDEPSWAASRGRGVFTGDAHHLEVSGTLDAFSGGTIEGRYTGTMPAAGGPREHLVTAEAKGLSLASVLRHYDLPGDDQVAPSAELSGRASGRWTGAEIDGMTGEAAMTFSSGADGGAAQSEEGALPVSGDARLSWKGRRITIGSSELETRGSHLRMTGR